ncbi:hypothetical protein LZK36_31380, partial [Pseudomonas aeruginosa]|nr:hypothetical protein [Pseudomonas aeruginosa]
SPKASFFLFTSPPTFVHSFLPFESSCLIPSGSITASLSFEALLLYSLIANFPAPTFPYL